MSNGYVCMQSSLVQNTERKIFTLTVPNDFFFTMETSLLSVKHQVQSINDNVLTIDKKRTFLKNSTDNVYIKTRQKCIPFYIAIIGKICVSHCK